MDRLFIAIDVPDNIKTKFLEITKKLNLLDAKTVPYENVHITLKFIGETTKTNDILNILESVKFSRFYILVKNAGVFPNIRNPRVFWVGIDESNEIKLLFNIIEEKLEKINILKDSRTFSPHITLARFKKPPNIQKLKLLLEESGKEFGQFLVEEFVLYKSELSYPNPKYYPIKSFRLL